MKNKIIILICIALMSTAVSAQEISADKVPASVMSAFKAKFPKAEKTEWEIDESDYEAEFKINNLEQSAKFDLNGKWVETETEIKVSELPQIVQQTISKEFAGFKVEEACKVENVENGSCYEVEVEKEEENYDVLVSAEGKVLSKKKEDENEKDDED